MDSIWIFMSDLIFRVPEGNGFCNKKTCSSGYFPCRLRQCCRHTTLMLTAMQFAFAPRPAVATAVVCTRV